MAKIDLKKQLKDLYNVSKKDPFLVDVPARGFVMVDGQGDPAGSQAFAEAMEAVFGVSYTAKFALKKAGSKIDYTVPPPESLWWADDLSAFAAGRRDEWRWTIMVPQPEHVTADLIARAIEELRTKKDPPALGRLRFDTFREGLSAQLLHVGPYDQMGASSIPKLHDFIAAQGRKMRGKHHEIYLSDPRRAAPEKLKTILRQPVE